MTHKELREQISEFRKTFNNKDEIKNRLNNIAQNKRYLEDEDILSMEKMRLSLTFGIDELKISMEDITKEMSIGVISEDDRLLYQEFIMLSDEAIRLSNEIIGIIDTIV